MADDRGRLHVKRARLQLLDRLVALAEDDRIREAYEAQRDELTAEVADLEARVAEQRALLIGQEVF